MKHLLAIAFITLLALGTGCAWVSPSSETTSDGIQVHGHWTLTVTNPDGTVDAVHEFDNELTTLGADLLTYLLAGEGSIEAAYIELYPASIYEGVFSCEEYDPLTFGFNSNLGASYLPAILQRDSNLDGSPLTLTATCTVSNLDHPYSFSQVLTTFKFNGIDMSINHVTSGNIQRDPNNWLAYLTRKTLDPNLDLLNNQTISFNVVISFE